MYLVIDTATRDLGVALMDKAEVAGQFHWRTRQNHTKELVPAIRHLLDKAGIGLNDLEGIVVSLGPGGFSGLRVGMTTAKGLAVGTGAPLVAVPTLDAAAYPMVGLGSPVCALMPAGRGEVAAAMYKANASEMEKTVDEHLTTIEALGESILEATIFCGPMTDEMESEIREKLRGAGVGSEGGGAGVEGGGYGADRHPEDRERGGRRSGYAATSLCTSAFHHQVDSAAGGMRVGLLT